MRAVEYGDYIDFNQTETAVAFLQTHVFGIAHPINMSLPDLELNSEDCYIVDSVDQKGVGLFATRDFLQGEDIYQMDYWSKPLMPMHSTNHSCDPNSSFNESGMLVALRGITKNEEITYDYLLHPIPASPWNFECQCLSKNCIGWVLAA